jgi:lysophospholipase L1-like esterase
MKKSIKPYLIPGIFLVIVFIALIIIHQGDIQKINNENTRPESDDQKRTIDHQNIPMRSLTERSIHNQTVLFLGDSLIAQGDWELLFPGIQIKNFGIGGATTQYILSRTQDIIAEKPDRIFLMIGINNIWARQGNPLIEQSYIDILDNLTVRSPDTQVYILSVLPVNHEKFNISSQNQTYIDNNQIIELNRDLEQLAKTYHTTEYIDLYSHFVNENDNELLENLTTDGVHLNDQGYAVWKDAIAYYIL